MWVYPKGPIKGRLTPKIYFLWKNAKNQKNSNYLQRRKQWNPESFNFLKAEIIPPYANGETHEWTDRHGDHISKIC